MKIRFVCRGKVGALQENYECDGEGLIVFGFGGLGEVNYEKELKGESHFFEQVAGLSKEGKNVVVCGCVTDTRGLKRKSAIVAEKGRICGVSDMLRVTDGEVNAGAGLRLYETSMGRMGVIVGEDIQYSETIRAAVLCGSDFIVCPYGQVRDSFLQTLLRVYAYSYGAPILFCGDGYAYLVSPSGTIEFASPQDAVVEFENVKEYHLIETRQRGIRNAPLL